MLEVLDVFQGMTLWQLTVAFAISAGAVVGAGIALARSGDVLATRTGLGGLFFGMLLLAGATSLPEIVTDVTAAASGAPDLAIGDLFGSSMANMAILAVIDLLHRGRVWPATGLGHARVASIAMALTAVVMLGIAAPIGVRIGWIGIESFVLLGGYILAARWVHRTQRAAAASTDDAMLAPVGLDEERGPDRSSLRRPIAMFVGAALVVIIAAPAMARSAQGIAAETGIEESFVGATMLAAATSLPELATSLAAVRLGAYDLAVGNLFGSNALNATIVFFADAGYAPGPILADVGQQLLVGGLAAMLLMAIALGGIVHGARLRFERGEPDALLVLVAYVGMLGLLWLSG